MQPPSSAFRDRVRAAAEAALSVNGSVGPLELLEFMQLLPSPHFEQWRKGHPAFPVLEPSIQVGPEKYRQTMHHFEEWIKERGLMPIEAPYMRRTPHGVERLQVTKDGDPLRERFYCTRFAPEQSSQRKVDQITEKLAKAPDLVVFEKVSEEGNCHECGAELSKGSLLFMEKGQPLCLTCADLDHLVFLPAGDTALSRRSRKHSPLSAVVVRFSRSRRRYERQGLLVTAAALAQAEEQCTADAPERAARRAEAAVARQEEDREFIRDFAEAVLKLYPACPAAEAQAIAEHSGQRSSGRVGRSAAGRALDSRALELAVRAHIRHVHTRYDELLMRGVERLEARAQVQEQIDRVADAWSGRSM